jgi:hypothetical protein
VIHHFFGECNGEEHPRWKRLWIQRDQLPRIWRRALTPGAEHSPWIGGRPKSILEPAERLANDRVPRPRRLRIIGIGEPADKFAH